MITMNFLGIGQTLPLTLERPRNRAGGPRGSFYCDPAWLAEQGFGQTRARYTPRTRGEVWRGGAAVRTPIYGRTVQAVGPRRRYYTDPYARSRRSKERRWAAERARQYARDLWLLRAQERVEAARMVARMRAPSLVTQPPPTSTQVITPIAPPIPGQPHVPHVVPKVEIQKPASTGPVISARLTPQQMAEQVQRILSHPPPELAAQRAERLRQLRLKLGIR